MRHGVQAAHDPKSLPWDPDAPLSPEGREGLEIGNLVLARSGYLYFAEFPEMVRFAFLASSPLRRSVETMEIVTRPAKLAVKPETWPDLGPTIEAWDHVFKVYPQHDLKVTSTVLAMYQAEPGLMVVEGTKVWGAVRDASLLIREGESALLVSHQPLIEMAAAVAMDEWPPIYSLEKGEMLMFTFVGGELKDIAHLAWPEEPK